MTLVWMPTYRCCLKCSYCAARALPNDTHGLPENELTGAQWLDIFAASPRRITQVAISGGEPAVYGDLPAVLAATEWRFAIDTNLRIDPARWLKPQMYERVVAVNCGLHFHPAHEEAVEYWRRLQWLREVLPAEAQVVCCQVVLWRDLADGSEEARIRAEQISGVEYRPLTFDDTYLFKDRYPVNPGRRAGCAAGSDFLSICPDGAVYRCIGHTYFKVDCLGNLRDGWGFLREGMTPCETLFCTICDMTDQTLTD